MSYSIEFNPVYCHRFSTSTCVIGNDGMGSSKDNKAPFTISEISGFREGMKNLIVKWKEK